MRLYVFLGDFCQKPHEFSLQHLIWARGQTLCDGPIANCRVSLDLSLIQVSPCSFQQQPRLCLKRIDKRSLEQLSCNPRSFWRISIRFVNNDTFSWCEASANHAS